MKWYEWVLKVLEIITAIGRGHVDKKNKNR